MKRGQIQLSFGMIFSIIIVIATLAVAGYFIVQFLNQKNTFECNQLYQILQEEVNKAWNEGDYGSNSKIVKLSAPSGIKEICIGNRSSVISEKKYTSEYEFMKKYASTDNNLILYPGDSCGSRKDFAKTILHIETGKFFCIESDSGKIELKLSIDSSSPLVKISK